MPNVRYCRRLICTVPAPLGVIAAAVGKAIDGDVGGEYSFQPHPDDATKLIADSPCAEDIAASVPYILANPAMLLATIERDLANRFPEYPRPTLEEVEAFCAAATVEVL